MSVRLSVRCAFASAIALASCGASVSYGGVVNKFDSAAEIGDWRFDYGGATQTKSFSTDDAAGSATSGSMQLDMTFGGANQQYAFTNDEFGTGTDLSNQRLDFDAKIVAGSAPDAFANNGYFQFFIRNTDNYNSVQEVGDNVKAADGWRHFTVNPVIGPANLARALTVQLYGGGAQNINGTVTLRLDNVVFSATPEPTTFAAALGGGIALLRRRRRH